MRTRRERSRRRIRNKSNLQSIRVQSITQYSERFSPTDVNQLQINTQKCKPNRTENSIQTFSPLNSIKPSKRSKEITPLIPTMDKVNGIVMNFIFKKRGHSPETDRLCQERNCILKPNKTRIVGRGSENERIQEYRPSQEGRKQIERNNILIDNRFFDFCEKIGTTPLRDFHENVKESWLNPSSDREIQISELREKCPTNVLRKIKKHESEFNPSRAKTAKQNALQDSQNEKTAEAIKKAEKDFSVDLPLLVDGTAKDTKILDAIIALENVQPDKIFYPYRPHREHLATHFGLLFYNDKIIVPEAMRSTIISMLHQGHVSTNKMDQQAEAGRSETKPKTARAAEPQVRV